MEVFWLAHTSNARAVSRDILEEVEQELFNYNFYKSFLDLTTKHNLQLNGKTKDRVFTVEAIQSSLINLPQNLQQFVKLRYIDRLTIETTAEKMNISPSACYKYRRQSLYSIGIALGKL